MALSLWDSLCLWFRAAATATFVLYKIVKDIARTGVKQYFHWPQADRPAILDDPGLGEHGYLHIKDVRIHYVASGPVDKPLMLFLHGFPEFWYTWRHQIKEFQKDYRVVAVDMRGYGQSDKPQGLEPYALRTLVQDVKRMILALGYQTCTLVAHDWGGIVAMAAGRIYPDYVEKLILMNTASQNILIDALRNDPSQRAKSWYMFLFLTPKLPELMLRAKDFATLKLWTMANDQDFPVYKYVYSQPEALTPPINYYRCLLREIGGRVQFDLNYSIPVLLIWGVNDPALGLAIPQTIQRTANENLEVKYIENAGHYVQHDAPEKVNKIMREWLPEGRLHKNDNRIGTI